MITKQQRQLSAFDHDHTSKIPLIGVRLIALHAIFESTPFNHSYRISRNILFRDKAFVCYHASEFIMYTIGKNVHFKPVFVLDS